MIVDRLYLHIISVTKLGHCCSPHCYGNSVVVVFIESKLFDYASSSSSSGRDTPHLTSMPSSEELPLSDELSLSPHPLPLETNTTPRQQPSNGTEATPLEGHWNGTDAHQPDTNIEGAALSDDVIMSHDLVMKQGKSVDEAPNWTSNLTPSSVRIPCDTMDTRGARDASNLTPSSVRSRPPCDTMDTRGARDASNLTPSSVRSRPLCDTMDTRGTRGRGRTSTATTTDDLSPLNSGLCTADRVVHFDLEKMSARLKALHRKTQEKVTMDTKTVTMETEKSSEEGTNNVKEIPLMEEEEEVREGEGEQDDGGATLKFKMKIDPGSNKEAEDELRREIQ